MNLLREIKERLSVFKSLYDAIRIVDDLKTRIITVIEGVLSSKYYETWTTVGFYDNCICMRAYNITDTFFKIEYDKEKNNSKDINLFRLNKEINELREVLNEVCSTSDTNETNRIKLNISESLDELIVEYMKALYDLK